MGGDLEIYWRSTSYFIRGITLEEAMVSPLPEIGEVWTDLVLPWGAILEQFLFPGFMSFAFVKVWYYFLLLVATFLLIYQLYRLIQERYGFDDKCFGILTGTAIMLISWYWFEALHTANPGTLLGILGALAFFYYKEKPFFASVLLCFSICKPQVGALFFLVFLLAGRIKVLLQSGGIMAVSWIFHHFYIAFIRARNGMPPLSSSGGVGFLTKLLTERIQFGNNQMNTEEVAFIYYGLFDPLRMLGVPALIVMILSALTGVCYVLFCFFKLKKDVKDVDMFALSGVAILASLFWMYKSQGDGLIIAICNALMVLVYLKDEKRDTTALVRLTVGLILMNCKVIKYFVRFAFGWAHSIGVVGDMLLQITIFTYFFMTYVEKGYHKAGRE